MENKNSGKTWVWLVIAIAIIAIITLSAKKEQPVPTETLSQTYTVTINNSSESQPLAPGVYIIHTDEASLDFADTLSPAELEPLAEYGSNTDFATFAGTLPGVVDVITIDAPILPGESTSFEITANTDGLFLSGIQMAVASNDGYALVNAIPLTGQATITPANNYDNGTEENSELGSGFEGGQPDPSQGADNIENGTATDPQAPVSTHEQLTDTILVITITPIVEEVAEELVEETTPTDDEPTEETATSTTEV